MKGAEIKNRKHAYKTIHTIEKHQQTKGEGNGNPCQYSCLENPMDRGACWAAVRGVAQKSETTEATQYACMHWRRQWKPPPVFLPGESQGPGSLVGCCLWGRTELDTTEATQQQQQQIKIKSIENTNKIDKMLEETSQEEKEMA